MGISIKSSKFAKAEKEMIYYHEGMPANNSKVLREEVLDYDGARILVLQKSNYYIARRYTLVLGQILEQKFSKPELRSSQLGPANKSSLGIGKPITTSVAPINREEYAELEELVKKAGFEGDVQFW